MKKACLYGLITAILITLAACGQDTATTIRLTKTEGAVHVSDGSGQDIEPQEDLMIYGGYGIDTAADSYAWMNLDDTKLTKMDEDSAIQIQKTGKNLEIQVDRGGLFFHVTEPLAEDETLDIRTSTMTVGIRGTCGWVVVPDPEHMILYLLEGTVECAAGENAATVTAWQMAVMTADGEITVTEFSQDDIPGFVWAELVKNTALAQAADHRHIWVYATCESAKYCVVCEETEGEPLDHEWIDATYTEPKTCSVCGLTEGEPLPEPYCVKNNMTFEKLEDMDLPFAISFTENGEVVDIDGMWIEARPAHYTFGEITVGPSEQEGYIKVTIPYEVAMSARIYADTSVSGGMAPFHYNCTYLMYGVGDYYTGIVVPARDTIESEGADFFQEYEWEGNTYSIAYSYDTNDFGASFSDLESEDYIIYYMECFDRVDVISTITIPEEYDGAVLFINRNGSTDVFIDEEIDTEEEYLLEDEDDADNYIFYRLSDIIQQSDKE